MIWIGDINFQARNFEFHHNNLKLRTLLPDEVYTILLQKPTKIPSSLPGLSAEDRKQRWKQLPLVPESESERESFLEDERNNRPWECMYRFYACGGFWLCETDHICLFLKGFDSLVLGELVPFLRQVLKVFTFINPWLMQG
jgi:hypothetical protein